MEPATAISGGSIVIHTPKGPKSDAALLPTLGDSNFDGVFNSADLVHVFQAGKYETGKVANFVEGDWNGDQVFDSSDFVVAFQARTYQPARAVDRGDAAASLFADELFLDSLRDEVLEDAIAAAPGEDG